MRALVFLGLVGCHAAVPSPAVHIAHVEPAAAVRVEVAPPVQDPSFCDKLAKDNDRVMRARAASAGCQAHLPDLACVVTPKGAGWGIAVTAVDVRGEAGQCDLETHADVVRGEVFAGESLAITRSADRDPPIVWSDGSVELSVLSDYDGDGNEEVLVKRSWWGHEAERGSVVSVWTFHHGRVERYAPASSFGIDHAEDVDHDGKLDLITCDPYCGIRAESQLGFDYAHAPNIFVAHALGSGGFSTTDAVAVAFSRAQCDAVQPDLQNEKLACERLHGRSEAQVTADLKAAGCVDFQGDPARYPQSCETWIPKLLAVTPPFRL